MILEFEGDAKAVSSVLQISLPPPIFPLSIIEWNGFGMDSGRS